MRASKHIQVDWQFEESSELKAFIERKTAHSYHVGVESATGQRQRTGSIAYVCTAIPTNGTRIIEYWRLSYHDYEEHDIVCGDGGSFRKRVFRLTLANALKSGLAEELVNVS